MLLGVDSVCEIIEVIEKSVEERALGLSTGLTKLIISEVCKVALGAASTKRRFNGRDHIRRTPDTIDIGSKCFRLDCRYMVCNS